VGDKGSPPGGGRGGPPLPLPHPPPPQPPFLYVGVELQGLCTHQGAMSEANSRLSSPEVGSFATWPRLPVEAIPFPTEIVVVARGRVLRILPGRTPPVGGLLQVGFSRTLPLTKLLWSHPARWRVAPGRVLSNPPSYETSLVAPRPLAGCSRSGSLEPSLLRNFPGRTPPVGGLLQVGFSRTLPLTKLPWSHPARWRVAPGRVLSNPPSIEPFLTLRRDLI
jgi:hypothetical protein